MRTVEISTEFIKLGQLLKLADMIGQGSDAKFLISEGYILVNDQIVTERGKKIRDGDIVELKDEDKVQFISTFKEKF